MKIGKLLRFTKRIVITFNLGVQIFVYIFVTIIFLEFGAIFGIISAILSLILFIYLKINFLPLIIFFIEKASNKNEDYMSAFQSPCKLQYSNTATGSSSFNAKTALGSSPGNRLFR